MTKITKLAQKTIHHLFSWSSFLGIIATVSPALTADEINFFYPPVGLTLQVESLEIFATDGTVNANLNDFLKITQPNEQQKAKFRQALIKPIDIDPVLLSRLLNTDEGDRLLSLLGETIEIQGGINGKTVLRGSIVQAASEPEGFTVLNFLQTLPTNIQINVAKSLRRSKQADFLVRATEEFMEITEELALEETQTSPEIDFSQIPTLAQRGTIPFVTTRWNLRDESRSRSFYVDVYRPELPQTGEIPVVIFSHGLGDQPESFKHLGEMLASYGFLVVMPQHPGSDTQQKEALLAGTSRELFRLNEFIDRPLDISYTLDELERRNQTEFAGKLNLTQVGAFGHSFGGYTALAVAGATIDFAHLEQDCKAEAGRFNMALFLQCRALQLQQPLPNLKDDRISAVVIANPVNASIFGPEGLAKITVPILIGAGGYDVSTPFIFEQVRSFPWLVNAPNSYLLLEEGESHVPISELDAGSYFTINSVIGLSLPDEDLRYYYALPSILAFAQIYLAGNEDYNVYLTNGYQQYLGQGQEFKAYLITEKSAFTLQEKFEKKAEEFRRI